MFLTVALFNQMAQSEPDGFAPMRYLFIGGEACDPQSVRRVLTHGKPQHLVNVCGPTETTTYSAWYDIEEVPAEAHTIPIGRAVANTELWVLDKHGHILPVGVPGELYVGGDGIAREYLGRPDLTAQKFVPDPFSTKPGARLYRSGDLCRYLSDGNVDLLRRMDQQVKIRGFRIELGEIEAVLNEHAAVRESVVVVREDAPNEKRLVAYIVTDSAQIVNELRSWLRDQLPEYFIPSFFIILDKLPLTPNGKVDRRALPAPEQNASLTEETLVVPRTPEEERIAAIWSDVLEIKPIGMETNFFDLGGHSLLATRVVTRIREAFGINLPLRVLFDSPTIAGVAAEVATFTHIVEKLTHLSDDDTRSLLAADKRA
jgi:acyl-coenzyme A synthetase/AMP-(fatty) acid ligase/acyl carrier protein